MDFDEVVVIDEEQVLRIEATLPRSCRTLKGRRAVWFWSWRIGRHGGRDDKAFSQMRFARMKAAFDRAVREDAVERADGHEPVADPDVSAGESSANRVDDGPGPSLPQLDVTTLVAAPSAPPRLLAHISTSEASI